MREEIVEVRARIGPNEAENEAGRIMTDRFNDLVLCSNTAWKRCPADFESLDSV